jgi:hypothetical protein
LFDDYEGWLKFIKNCSRDPELKQNELATESISVSEEDFKTISNSAHKLMHFIWDGNPRRTPLFMGVLERYSSSALNYYTRLFRKIIRMGGQKVRQTCSKLAEKLRQGEP